MVGLGGWILGFFAFKHQSHRMVKVNADEKSTNCLSVLDHFVGLGLKGLIPSLLSKVFYSILLRYTFKNI